MESGRKKEPRLYPPNLLSYNHVFSPRSSPCHHDDDANHAPSPQADSSANPGGTLSLPVPLSLAAVADDDESTVLPPNPLKDILSALRWGNNKLVVRRATMETMRMLVESPYGRRTRMPPRLSRELRSFSSAWSSRDDEFRRTTTSSRRTTGGGGRTKFENAENGTRRSGRVQDGASGVAGLSGSCVYCRSGVFI